MTKITKFQTLGIHFRVLTCLGLFGRVFVSDLVLRIWDFDLILLGRTMSEKKILLVEDNEVNRRLAEFLLRSQGYEVIEAASAEQAFEMLATERPDLIVMDIQLPGIDGLEATRKLKEQSATADIPRSWTVSRRSRFSRTPWQPNMAVLVVASLP